MADYKTMYYKLFHEMNDTINRFQKKLLEVEDIYIETDFQSHTSDEPQENNPLSSELLEFVSLHRRHDDER